MASGKSSDSPANSGGNPYLHPDQLELISMFIEHGVKFLLVGGHAFTAHAHIRATKDIDLWIEPTSANAKAVYGALARFGAPLQTHGVTPDDFAEVGQFYQLGLPPARIDLLTEMAGIDFTQAYERCLPTTLAGLPISVLSLDDLIDAKLQVGRPRDLLDAKDLLRVKARLEQPKKATEGGNP